MGNSGRVGVLHIADEGEFEAVSDTAGGQALKEVKYSWRDDKDVGYEYGVYPFQYDAKAEYSGGLLLLKEKGAFQGTQGV